MKIAILAFAFMMTISIFRHDAEADSWNYMIVASHETPFLGQGWWTVRHTWSDAWSSQDNQDATQSWMSGVGRCWTWGTSGCAKVYRSWSYSHSAWYSTTGSKLNWYLDRHNWDKAVGGMIYLVNGVCHTATNRASRQSGLKRVADYGVLGSRASQSAFGTCGKYSPWGYGLSCP